MRKLTKYLPLLTLFIALATMSAACSAGQNKPSVGKQARDAVATRAATYARAEAQVPTPNITNFPRRATLAESTIRQSLPNHPWYVYLLGDNGNTIGYYVAKSVPVNDCDYLSSTQDVTDHWDATVVLDAPSLEGIYQSSSGCQTLILFDRATNAEIQVNGMHTYISDRPLKVDAKPITVKSVR